MKNDGTGEMFFTDLRGHGQGAGLPYPQGRGQDRLGHDEKHFPFRGWTAGYFGRGKNSLLGGQVQRGASG